MKETMKKFEWEIRNENILKFLLNTKEGIELQLCLISQGYLDKLFYDYALFFGSYWSAGKIINNIKKDYNLETIEI